MWTAIKAFLTGNIAVIAEWFGAIGAVLGAILAIFNAGKESEKNGALLDTAKEIKDAKTIEDKNRADLAAGAAAASLRKDWGR